MNEDAAKLLAQALKAAGVTVDQLRQFLESVSQLMIAAHDNVPPAAYDTIANVLVKIDANGYALIASLLGIDAAGLQNFVTNINSNIPEVKNVFTSPIMIGLARFLHDAENRTIILSLIGRWL